MSNPFEIPVGDEQLRPGDCPACGNPIEACGCAGDAEAEAQSEQLAMEQSVEVDRADLERAASYLRDYANLSRSDKAYSLLAAPVEDEELAASLADKFESLLNAL